ncbi:LytR/AlgR family response regulator transcription factor [Aquimarina sp. 2201CG14-23]|uniref:LytR/AlgR family response regulator transcription factor n=1 Tax=Aquimarina mycalae TaxID=3040073 RepID=UPI002477D60D|nr:LytTR family DNA-binding domain-containing protein [Aquimarina sp. 2201CG14-23]MDH7445420.1 LytTR family DNA-binding domain-containing protein [Aquimarina sp. 2201CG14-23]
MKILILEDEIPAYQKLIMHLNSFFGEDFSHDWSRSVKNGNVFLQNNIYDVILSDIQLLDGTSFDLFNNISVDCPIIFCSAHDEYLFQAFNTNGIAYILKPYSKNDFEKAIEKYQSLFKQGLYNVLDHTTIDILKSAIKKDEISYKKRFVIKRTKGIQLLNVADISIVNASGDFCVATDLRGKTHPILEKIGVLTELLNPKKFFRINRSQIIHIEYIETIENHFKNRLLIKLIGLEEKVMTSSSTTSDFRKWIEQ